MSLRVALDATPLLGDRTGVGVFAVEVLERLGRRQGLTVTAYGVTWRGRRHLASRLPAGVRPARWPMAARPLREAWGRLGWPPIEVWTGAVDVVHGTNFVVPPSRRAARLVTVHDLTALHFPELCTADTRRYPQLLRTAIDGGALVHAVSAAVAEEVVQHLGADRGRVRVVANGVSEVGGGDPVRGRHLAGGASYALALGTVEPRKDLPGLVAAFDRLAPEHPGLRLVLAGADGWGAEALATALARSSSVERVTRLGRVSDDDRAALLAGAAVLAYPSRYEGFGLPPLEAMSVGVPVVATAVGALPEVLGDAALLVPPGDPDALAAALATVLTEPAVAARLRSDGRERAGRYTWERTVEGLVKLYQDAVARR